MITQMLIAAVAMSTFGNVSAAGLYPGAAHEDDDKLCLVAVWDWRTIKERNPHIESSNLDPVLVATKDVGGVLKGVDSSAKPKFVIAIPPANVPEARQNPVVRSLTETVPRDWVAVTELKISYREGVRPSDDDLTRLGLKMIEVEPKLFIMVVQPVNGRIDATLVTRLERCAAFTHVTPRYRVRAI
jgi:hypothetical protein